MLFGEEFNEHTEAVTTFNFKHIKLFSNIDVNLWNGPGQEKFRTILSKFLPETDIIIFVYDITKKSSFDYLNCLIKMAKDKLGNKIIGAIVGNKSDLFFKREVEEEEAEKLAKEQGYKFYLVSAKENPIAFRNCLEELVIDYIIDVQPDL